MEIKKEKKKNIYIEELKYFTFIILKDYKTFSLVTKLIWIFFVLELN